MDDEIKGKGNSINYSFRMHDPRLGRFFAIDPLAGQYPWNSTYAFSENRVIEGIELEGLEVYFSATGVFLGMIGDKTNREIQIVSAENVKRVKEAITDAKMFTAGSECYNKAVYTANHLSTSWMNSNENAQAAVSASIFKIWIKSESGVKQMISRVPTWNSYVGATSAAGVFKINRTSEDNNNLFNQINLWFHENMHSDDFLAQDNGTAGGTTDAKYGEDFRHYEILVAQSAHWSWNYTTQSYRDNMQRNGYDYLMDENIKISNETDPSKKAEMESRYQKDLSHYLKTFNMTFEYLTTKQHGNKYNTEETKE